MFICSVYYPSPFSDLFSGVIHFTIQKVLSNYFEDPHLFGSLCYLIQQLLNLNCVLEKSVGVSEMER